MASLLKKAPVKPIRFWMSVAAALLLGASLGGCAVVEVAGAATGAAISVAGAVVSTGVTVTGKVVGAGIDAARGSPEPAPKPAGE